MPPATLPLLLVLLAAAPTAGASDAASAAAPAPPAAAAPACPPSQAQTLSLPHLGGAAPGVPLRVVAFGSSSTEGIGASDPGRAYPARLQRWLGELLPGRAVEVLNRGRGGEEVGEMLRRLDADVLAEHPQLVIWQAGANAVLRGLTPEVFRDALEDGLARMHGAGIDVVLLDSQRAPMLIGAGERRSMDPVMATTAAGTGTALFSRAAMMRDWFAAGAAMTDVIGPDGLHHTDRGYDCLAAALGNAIAAAITDPAPGPALDPSPGTAAPGPAPGMAPMAAPAAPPAIGPGTPVSASR